MIIDGTAVEARPGGAIYSPSDAMHEARSIGDIDALFFTIKPVLHDQGRQP